MPNISIGKTPKTTVEKMSNISYKNAQDNCGKNTQDNSGKTPNNSCQTPKATVEKTPKISVAKMPNISCKTPTVNLFPQTCSIIINSTRYKSKIPETQFVNDLTQQKFQNYDTVTNPNEFAE